METKHGNILSKTLTIAATTTDRTPRTNFFFAFSLFAILLMTVFPLPSVIAQTTVQDKIDPAFRSLMMEGKSAGSDANAIRTRGKVKPTEGFAAPGAPVEKRYECIVYTNNAKALQDSGIIVNSILPNFVTAWVTTEQIRQMAGFVFVNYIRAPATVRVKNDVAVGSSGASLLHQGRLNNTMYKGKNVIVAIFDSGLDWKHKDFRNPADTTKSRVLRMWDQTITATTGESKPAGFSYGVEYTQAQINNELDGTPANFVREKDTDGHGTHVTGTAAGNGASLPSGKFTGMAPEADLVIIKGGDSTFSSTHQIDALTYLKTLATQLGKPVVVNMSLGSLFGPHDGTLPEETAIDNFTSSATGRAVVVAAGNDNGTNKHNRFTLAGNASGTVSFNVPAGTEGSYVLSYLVYVNDNSNITATLTAPNSGGTVTAAAGQSRSGRVLNNGFNVFVDNLTDPGNNDRYVEIDIDRNGSGSTSPGGIWTLSLTNTTATPLTLDGWLYDLDDAFRATSLAGGDNNYIVASPGNATSAITAASYAAKNSWYSNTVSQSFAFKSTREDSISTFSSRGPRRDGVLKPDIAADGDIVASCLSSNATSFSGSLITEPGLYAVARGTSMAAPGVAGAVALLFQTHPAATAAQVKGYLTAAAVSDALTRLPGAIPNTTWGYGKLDVFNAAAAAFNCIPAVRTTYKYDSSTTNPQETGLIFSSQRLAIRFTPDISGKLGGVFFHTSSSVTGLFAEVRTNNAGNPGSLLGTVNIDSSAVARYAFNYIDLSNLNVSVTNGTDYFIVLGGRGGGNWSLRQDDLAVSGRSLQSLNNGASWTVQNTNYKIRPVVYTDKQLSGTLATVNSADSRNITTSNQFINSNCQLISQLLPAGVNPVADSITAKVWIEAAVPHDAGNPYVQRHYETSPKTGASTATGRVTLYFTQDEFNAFNNDPGSALNLPASPADTAGKANVRVGKYPGTSSDNSGLPGTYSGTPSVVDPADGDIVWNTEAKRWEVSFDATGFGGFVLQTTASVLPLTISYFKGEVQRVVNMVNWKVSCYTPSITFNIERSANGRDFTSIGTLTATKRDCLNPFSFNDQSPLPGANYYRIKITQSTGIVTYTGVILLQTNRDAITRLFPNLIEKGGLVQVQFTGTKGVLTVTDVAGRQILSKVVVNGIQSISLPVYSPGLYFYNIKQDKLSLSSGKIIVQ